MLMWVPTLYHLSLILSQLCSCWLFGIAYSLLYWPSIHFQTFIPSGMSASTKCASPMRFCAIQFWEPAIQPFQVGLFAVVFVNLKTCWPLMTPPVGCSWGILGCVLWVPETSLPHLVGGLAMAQNGVVPLAQLMQPPLYLEKMVVEWWVCYMCQCMVCLDCNIGYK